MLDSTTEPRPTDGAPATRPSVIDAELELALTALQSELQVMSAAATAKQIAYTSLPQLAVEDQIGEYLENLHAPPDPHRQAVMSQAVALRNARAEGYEVARAAAFVSHAMHPSKTTPIIDHNGVCICERCQSSSSKSEGAVGRLATLQGDVQRLQQMLEGHPTAPHEVGRSWLQRSVA